MGKNRTHVMISSNATWVVPASSDERRFCVTEALDTKLDDFKYFDAITDELENGGYEAMLYDLLTRDLSGFNVFTVPKTKALDDQKSESMSGEYKWWRDVLYSGCLGGLFGQKWNEQFANKTLYQSYLASKPYRPLSKYNFGRFLSPMTQKDARVLNAEGEREHGKDFGSLAIARKRFDEVTKIQNEWPEILEDAESESKSNVVGIDKLTKILRERER
jgi:hypothetical protein